MTSDPRTATLMRLIDNYAAAWTQAEKYYDKDNYSPVHLKRLTDKQEQCKRAVQDEIGRLLDDAKGALR